MEASEKKEPILEKLERLVKVYTSIKISHDDEDGFFIELLDAGRVNESYTVADDDLDEVRESIYSAIEAALEYLEKRNKDF